MLGGLPGPGGPPQRVTIPGSGGGPAGAQGGGDGPDNPTSAKALQQAATALQAALKSESDPQDKATIAKLIAQVHAIEAGRQKEADAAMGVGPGLKFVRRQSQAQQGA